MSSASNDNDFPFDTDREKSNAAAGACVVITFFVIGCAISAFAGYQFGYSSGFLQGHEIGMAILRFFEETTGVAGGQYD